METPVTRGSARRTIGRRQVIRWVVVGVITLLVLNIVGVARYPGGPLRDPSDDGLLALDIRPADQGYGTVGNDPVDWAATGKPLYFGTLFLVNEWPLDATVEAVTPLELTPGLTVERVLIGVLPAGAESAGWGDETLMASVNGGVDETLGGALRPAPVAVPAASSPDRATNVLLVLSAARPGRYGFRGIAIDYRVGPFTFRATQYVALNACIGPFTAGQECATGE